MIKNILDKKNKKRNVTIAMKIKQVDIKLSAIILTKNEENNIVDCIESVLWCDEIVIVDDNSGDRTVEIVRNLRSEKIRVLTHSLDNDFSSQRNYGLDMANGEWVLFVDADERVTDGLKNEIEHLIRYSDRVKQLNGYFIKRRDFIWDKELKHGETRNITLLRLARKDAERWVGAVHEVWKVKGRIGELKNSLYHYPHQSINEFLQELNLYTDLRAKELFSQGVKPYWLSIVIYPLGKFLLNFILKQGFRDGMPGFIFAILMSFHSFLAWSKLYLLNTATKRRNKLKKNRG